MAKYVSVYIVKQRDDENIIKRIFVQVYHQFPYFTVNKIEKNDLPKSASFQNNSILISLSYNYWCCYAVTFVAKVPSPFCVLGCDCSLQCS